MNDTKGMLVETNAPKDAGITCSELPTIVATARRPAKFGPGHWAPKGPDPMSSSNYLQGR